MNILNAVRIPDIYTPVTASVDWTVFYLHVISEIYSTPHTAINSASPLLIQKGTWAKKKFFSSPSNLFFFSLLFFSIVLSFISSIKIKKTFNTIFDSNNKSLESLC